MDVAAHLNFTILGRFLLALMPTKVLSQRVFLVNFMQFLLPAWAHEGSSALKFSFN